MHLNYQHIYLYINKICIWLKVLLNAANCPYRALFTSISSIFVSYCYICVGLVL